MKRLTGLAAAALVATSLATLPAPAQAHPAGDRAVSAGATWLKSQLTGGILHNDEYDYDDLGLSADVAFALDAVGQPAAVAGIVDAIEPDVESWVGDPFTPGRVYAGSVAKMVSVVQAAGQDPTAYGGTDQVARLAGLVSSAPGTNGRLEDAGVDTTSPYDADFVNVIGQSFAARALTTAGSLRASDATAFLLDQQCDDGFFRADLAFDKAAAEQGCVDDTDVGSVDSTALTVINILDTPGASAAAKGAAYLAASWLKGQQLADGSFSGGAVGVNANSTGLAAWALAEAGQDGAATRAATWLRGLQVADLAPCSATLAGVNGAVLYQPDDLSAARTAGALSVPARERARRATAQALPALASVPVATGTPALAVPATATEKSAVSVTVSGLGAGEPGCVSLGSTAKPVTGTGSPVTVALDLPAGAGPRTVTLTTLGGSVSASTIASLAPTPAAPSVGAVDAPRTVKVDGRKFSLAVTCDAAVACTGKLKVSTASKVKLATGKKVVVLAKRSYRVAPGGEKDLVLKLTKPGRALLASGKVKVKAVQTAKGAEPATTRFWLKIAKG
ncbi:hypothetical protein SAMN04489844_0067 [Nocardioides exalbidus]|uniref:Prenyltransferase and squalene oxidase repeat-containing protein n=1 Tax=Nocardioides exalbidus TaxID=402596 RepID=A0A1H4I3X8_9ACTN|nr:hypothetical protein [Nocardioides exalbidus]SEB28620.1 hypothetical protein SAMN04489844_0067 [Nocardioides exalbidus]